MQNHIQYDLDIKEHYSSHDAPCKSATIMVMLLAKIIITLWFVLEIFAFIFIIQRFNHVQNIIL